MRILFSRPNDLEIVASTRELTTIAKGLEGVRVGEMAVFAASVGGDPAPYASFLRQLSVRVTTGPVELSVIGETLNVQGGEFAIRAFASFFFCNSEDEGTHKHFEYFEGNEFVSPRSVPLVIANSGSAA